MAVEIVPEERLVRVTFSGSLTADDLTLVIRETIQMEANLPISPDRLVDFGESTNVAVSFANVATIATARREIAPRNPIRTAIVVYNAAQRGYARMFQIVNDHPLVTVRIFESREDAKEWLARDGENPAAEA
jgi:hypothetical protein